MLTPPPTTTENRDHDADAPPAAEPTREATPRSKWVFLGRASLPSDPVARRIEKRGLQERIRVTAC